MQSNRSSIGPAIIVASVVLGPGSILANSKVGAEFGYDLVWVLVIACLLMIVMATLAARLGVLLDGTLCSELATRLGRPWAIAVGGSLFLVAACFQFSNNLGVLYGIEPFVPTATTSNAVSVGILLALNTTVIVVLLTRRELYSFVERTMKLLVALMVTAFAINLFAAKPSVSQVLKGAIPRLPVSSTATPDAFAQDHLFTVLGLIATTFSVAAAFYQSYLVRQKGWTKEHLRQGRLDNIVGVSTLGITSLMIMVTAAAVLHGGESNAPLKSAADVAQQLEPLFGHWGAKVFGLGILAGSMSSFLVNALIGGTVLADAIGKSADADNALVRKITVALLVFGMCVAIAIRTTDVDISSLIVFAQAVTVLGNPLMVGALLWLAYRSEVRQTGLVSNWLLAGGWIGFAAAIGLSVRTIYRLV